MTDRPLVILGISGFGRELADVVDATGRQITGFLDDNPSGSDLNLIARRNSRFLGSVDCWLAHAEPHEYLVGIGAGQVRQRLARTMDAAGHDAAIAIHPSVTIGHGTRISPGAVLCAGVRVSNNVELARHVHLNPGVIIGHDASLASYVSINPSATVSGRVRIGSRTLVGAAATILQALTVAEDVTVGAGAVVTKSVPAGVTLMGVPGRWPE